MWVKLVQRMATGMELTPEELRDAKVYEGHLSVIAGTAYLTTEEFDTRNGHLVPPLYDPVISIKGDRIVVTGTEIYLAGIAHRHPQKWTCKVVPRAAQ